MRDKKEVRSHFTKVRKAARSDEKDRLIAARLISLEEIGNADTVLMFASFGSEINTWEIAGKLLTAGKKLAYPKCGRGGVMTFHLISGTSDLKAGAYGISEPESSLPCPDVTSRTVCIVPGLAFTEAGARLGYGGGFYDRFLEKYPEMPTIALAYEAMITKALPTERHDAAVKYIVTEERTVLCK